MNLNMSILRNPDRVQLMYGGFRNQNTVYLSEQTDVSICFEQTASGMKILVTGTDTPITFIKCRWNTRFPIGSRFLGDALERAYGTLRYEGMRPERVMPWYCAVYYKEENLGFGVKVRPNSFVNWQTDPSGVTLWLDLRCGTEGFSLHGNTICAAELVEYRAKGDVYDFLHEFCARMTDHPVLPNQPVYGFNNWYYAYGNISADGVLADAKLLSSLTERLDNRPFMVIDDGWQKGGMQESTVECRTNEKFPDMKALADAIKALHVRPGVWIRPMKPTADRFTNLRHEAYSEYFDPSMDEVLDIIAADMEKLTGEWGYELIKHDYTTFDIFGDFFFHPTIQMSTHKFALRNPMTNAQAVKRLYQTIFDHSNGAIIIGCNCISHLGCGYFHLHRSGDDTSGTEWERTRYMGVNTLAFRLCQHKNFFEIDADCVGCSGTTDYTWSEASRFLELLSDSNTPLFVSIEPTLVTDEVRAQLKAAFAKASRQQGVFKPLDLTETAMPTRYKVDRSIKEYCFDDAMGAAQPIQ